MEKVNKISDKAGTTVQKPAKETDYTGKYVIKKTDFERSVVTTYMELDIAFFGSSTAAWNRAMSIIAAANIKARNTKDFYWIKYK